MFGLKFTRSTFSDGEAPSIFKRMRAAVAFFSVLTGLAVSPSVFCLSPNCNLTDTSYAVARENFEYEDVSFSYSWHIYQDVREIVRNYLADDPDDEYGCFYQPDYAGFLVELNCLVKRISEQVQLSVEINRIDSGNNLLKFDATAPFFRPEAVVARFAEAFPESFRGKVVRQNAYNAPQPGFYLLGGIGLWLGNVNYSAFSTDYLYYDLSRTEELPPGLLHGIERFQKTEKFEWAAFIAIALGTLAMEFTSPFIFDSNSERYYQYILAVSLPGVVATAAIGVDLLLFRPRRLFKILSPLNYDL